MDIFTMQNPTAGTASPVPTARDLEKAIAHADLPHSDKLQVIRNKEAFIIDMDGVIYHGSKLLDGTIKFIEWLKANNKKFLFLTNNSAPTPRELQQKLHRLGIDVDESHFYTSAICTAKFLCSQRPRGTVFCLGAPGLHYALYEHGFTMSDVAADYVVVGEGGNMSYENIAKAVKLVNKGAKLIGTNPDVNGPAEDTLVPACGAFVSTIELATGKKAFFCGKPNSIMLRTAQRLLGVQRGDAVMVGDRMDTDILGGLYAELDTVLVLSGVTKQEDLVNFSYSPYIVLNGVGDITGPVAGDEGEESRRLTDLP